MKLAVFAGIRPHYVKSSILRAFASAHSSIDIVIINAGQHYSPEMLVNSQSGTMVFDHELAIDRATGSVADQIRSKAEAFLSHQDGEVDCCVVMGDADCTVAAASAAVAVGVPVVNLEAGIRGPSEGPEADNALVVDRLSTMRLAASQAALTNLRRERLEPSYFVGDVYLDLVLGQLGRIYETDPLSGEYPYVLVSGHHLPTSEAFRSFLERLAALLAVAGFRTVVLGHPKFGELQVDGVEMVAPLNHIDLLGAVHHSAFVVTDSGGVQRECYYLAKRCLLIQDRAWWPELVAEGAHRVIGVAGDIGLDESVRWAVHSKEYLPNLSQFGSGRACERILEAVSSL